MSARASLFSFLCDLAWPLLLLRLVGSLSLTAPLLGGIYVSWWIPLGFLAGLVMGLVVAVAGLLRQEGIDPWAYRWSKVRPDA